MMSLLEELSKELEKNPKLARSLARKLIEYIEPELTVSYQISKMVEQLSKIAEEQRKIWEEIKDLREEQTKIWEEIKGIKEEQKKLREEQTKIWEEIRDLREEQTKIWQEIKGIKEEIKGIKEEQTKIWEEIRDLREEQTKIWQEIRDIKEEQKKLREDFNEMLATIRELQGQQRSLERGMDRMYERLSASIIYAFGELSKFAGMTFEEFVRRFLTDRMVRAGEIPEGSELRRAVVDGEEIDLFSEEPLIVGEVTAHAESAAEVDKLLRKASKVREVYGREPRKILVVETARKEVAKELRKRAKEKGIELVIGKEY